MADYYLTLILWCTFGIHALSGQMPTEGDTLYGPEWIDEAADYYRIPIAEDGLYRISTQQLIDAGLPVEQIQAVAYRMFRMGREVPLYISSDQVLDEGDYIEFRGRKNRNGLDSFLFQNGPSDQLNPEYSFFTDTCAYFLTWSEGTNGMRYTNSNDANLPPHPELEWYYHTDHRSFESTYIKPYSKVQNLSVTNSPFLRGEGYGTNYNSLHEFQFELAGYVPDVAPVTLDLRLLSSYANHSLEIRANDTLIYDETMDIFQFEHLELEIPPELIETTSLTITIEGTSGGSDRYVVGSIALQYAKNPNFLSGTDLSLTLPARDSSLVRWGGLDPTEEYLLYQPESLLRTQMINDNGIWASPLGASGHAEAVEVFALNDIKTAPSPQAVSVQTYREYEDRDYIILTSKRFMNPHIQEYADYRASDLGGSYKPLIVEVEDLYTSYGYGIERHSIAIRNFMHYVRDHWGDDLYVFIIGKGREHQDLRSADQLERAIQKGFYVPTFGRPGSDNLLLSTNRSQAPIFPLGRLAVSKPGQVANYLGKIKVMESYAYDGTVSNSSWLREVIHMNGGNFDAIQIAALFDRMVDTLASSDWNPRITDIVRNTNEPVQTEDMEEVFEKINKGANLVNYFGHSSATTLAIDINRPDAFENYTRMPFLLTLGCSAGNLNIEGESLGETYVLYDGKGFIGSWASGHFGILQILGEISQVFYGRYANTMRGEPIGRIIQQTLMDVQDDFPRHTAQMMLMCDPAYTVPMPEGTDLVVDPASMKLTPEVIPTTRDSFSLRFSVSNLGLVSDGETQWQLIREFPDQSRDTLPMKTFDVPEQGKTFEVRFPVGGLDASGINKLYIEIDPLQSIAEGPLPQAEENNVYRAADSTLGYSFLIEDKRIRPLLPQNFAIVPTDTVTLVATGTRHTPDERSVLIQMDTTEYFNSPANRIFKRNITGNTLQLPVEVRPNQVYYWRSTADYSAGDTSWTDETYSFIHLPGREGWNQSHRGQFLRDSMSGLQVPRETGHFWLDTTVTSYNLKNQYFLNSEEWLYITHDYSHVRQNLFWINGFSGAYVVVIDPVTTLLGMKNPPMGAFGSYNPFHNERRSFSYHTNDSSSRRDLMRFIADTVPDSMFVIFTLNPFELGDTFGIADWQEDSLRYDGKNLFNFFEGFGAKDIRKLKERGPVPYTFMFRKNDRAYGEGIASSQDETIVTEGLFRVLRESGSARSPMIGPVAPADSLAWSVGDRYWQEEDQLSIRLIGFEPKDGPAEYLDSLELSAGDSILPLPAENHPYYALEFHAADEVLKTIPPLNYWRVFHKSTLPELIFDAETKYKGPADTVPQGYTGTFEIAIKNVGASMQQAFDLDYRLINEQNEWVISGQRTHPPLSNGDSWTFDFNVDLEGATGRFTVLLQINPEQKVPERSYENNIFQQQFFVEADQKSPRLNVLFDGRQLTDYEPIRSNPVIEVRLRDDNPAALIDDQSSIEWTIEHESGSVFPLVPTDTEVDFTPAESVDEAAVWSVQATFDQAGVYSFRVNGSDVAGNEADAVDYHIHFTIEDQNRISYLLNFPNPVSTYTRFKYRFTGGEPLEEYKIEIYNLRGQHVRTLTAEDLGPLNPGSRYTEGYWRGTDDRGSPLDSGIYFYKLFPGDDAVEHLPRSFDSLFEDGWGRLTIIR